MTDRPDMAPPPRPVRIRTLVSWGLVGQVSFLLTQLVTLIGLTRLTSVETVGTVGLATSVVIPVFFFFNLGMGVNFASGKSAGFAFRDYRAVLAASVAAGYALIVAIALTFFGGLTASLILILGLSKASEAFSELSYGVFQRYEKMHFVAMSLLLRGIVSTLTVWCLLSLGYPVWGAFLGQMLVWVAVSVLFDQRMAARLARQEGDVLPARFARMRILARASFMLGVTGLVSALHGNMPRYIIASFLSVVSLGYFTVVGYAMQAVSTMFWVIMNSLVARFALYLSERDVEALRRVTRNLAFGVAGFAIIAVSVSVVIGDLVVARLFGPSYTDLGSLLAVCMLAASIQGIEAMTESLILARRRFGQLLGLRVFAVVALALCCTAGLWLGDLMGLVWGICLAYGLHSAALLWTVRPALIGER